VRDYRARILTAAALLLFAIGSIYCGGGGGDSAPPSSQSTPAVLTDNNVDAALVDIMHYVPSCKTASPGTGSPAYPVLASPIPETVEIFVTQGRGLHARLATRLLAPVTEPIPDIAGSCGGKITGSITADNVTFAISGSIVFNNYCDNSATSSATTINGPITFNGVLDITKSITLNLVTPGIDVTSSGGSFHGAVDLGMVLDNTTATVTIRSFSAQKSGDKSISGQNVVITMTEDPVTLRSQFQINGTIVDSKYGSMQIATIDKLVANDNGMLISGSGKITGASNTEVKVTLVGNNVFRVGLDNDGNKDYKEYSKSVDCSSLDVTDIISLIGGI